VIKGTYLWLACHQSDSVNNTSKSSLAWAGLASSADGQLLIMEGHISQQRTASRLVMLQAKVLQACNYELWVELAGDSNIYIQA